MPFDPGRFLAAQDPVLDQVRRELAQGRKQTHWMWFVFPQIRGLGSSPMAMRYAISGIEELGKRNGNHSDIVGSAPH